jgi:hypothetical protein
MAVPVHRELIKAFPGASIIVHDPIVDDQTLRSLEMIPVDSLEQTFTQTSLSIILNNHPIYATMPIETITEPMARPAFVYDCWNNFIERPVRLPSGVSYIALGSQSVPIG